MFDSQHVSAESPITEWQLDTRRIGRRVLVFERLDSTNNYAAVLARDPANDGLVILAREQTAGRGQHGRTWLCEAGAGVLLSVVLFPPPALRRPVILAALAANSVCETILECTGLEAQIKWPNDVLVRNRKVCGILIEQGNGTIAGIGLNVNQDERSFLEQRLPHAGSLALLSGRKHDCNQIAQNLIKTLDSEYNRLCQGDLATLQRSWKARIGIIGRLVTVECHDRTLHGRLEDATWESVLLDTAERGKLRLVPETVKHIFERNETRH